VGPDLVVLQEATDPRVVSRLASMLDMPHHAAARGRSLAFMSRLPVDHFEWHRPRFSRHAFLEIAPAGMNLRVFGLHLSAVHSAWTERRRMIEMRALLASIARHQHGLHVLTGDFNTLAPGELLDGRLLPARLRALVWLSGGKIRWRTIQHVIDSGYVDVFRHCHPDTPGFTFPTWNPHIRLDFAFVPGRYGECVKTAEVITTVGTATASDHLPVLIEVEGLSHSALPHPALRTANPSPTVS
jgi:endonuclease/exonuclease/phosphatase family metal-dependent hydrolase